MAHNVTFWLDSVTLLGAVRDHSLIPFDNDADFGVDWKSFEMLRDSPALVSALAKRFKFSVRNSSIHDSEGRDDNIPARIIDTWTGLSVDVFVFLESRDSDANTVMGPRPSVCFTDCKRCPRLKGSSRNYVFQVPREWIFPLATFVFANKSMPCLGRADKYLDHLYGANYMTPIQW